MTTLITGGASQTGLVLAKLLKASNRPVLIASRSGRVPDGYDSVKFDWLDPTTFSAPFEKDSNIKYVYLLLPGGSPEDINIAKPLIDIAVEKGVKRFILLSGTSVGLEKDALITNRVQAYLEGLEGVEYVALRPTWFTENLINSYGTSIKAGLIENTVATGRIPFIAVDDIGQAAFDAIVAEKVTLKEPILVGPDYVTYSEVAEILSNALGRPVAYKPISKEEAIKRYTAKFGSLSDHVALLYSLEEATENGREAQWTSSNPKVVVGKLGVKEWIEKYKGRFA